MRSQLSPDGSLMAFVKRVRTKTVLYLHNLKTAEEWPLYDDLSKDQQEAWAIFGLYPNFNWTPDGKNIIIWAKGKLINISVSDLSVTNIPFEAEGHHKITETVKFKNNPAPDQFTVKVIRNAVTSPDGKTIVFHGAGYLWKKNLPNGKPQRLTSGTDLEFEPAFSKDGDKLTFVTWNDDSMGGIHTLDMKTRRANPVKARLLSRQQLCARRPVYPTESGLSGCCWMPTRPVARRGRNTAPMED